MHQVNLKAKLRDKTKKSYCKKIRREGLVPGVIYGKKFDNLLIQVETKDLLKALSTSAGNRVIVNLEVEGEGTKNTYTTMITEIQKDVFQKHFLHIDFHKISLDEKVHAEIPIILKGEARGVKMGGILDQVLWRIPVLALPLDLPERIEVDVTELGENDSLSIADLKLPDGIKCLIDADEIVAIVHPPKVAEEGTTAEGTPSSATPSQTEKAKAGV